MSSKKPKQGYKLVTGDFREELEIPSIWKISMLSNLAEKTKAGGTPKSTESSFYGGKIPFVSIRDISKCKKYLEFTEKTLTEKGLKNSAGWKIPSNSILFSMYATIGKPIINKIEVCTHQGILGIIADTEKIDNEFLYYGLLNIKGKLTRYFLTGTQSNLNLDVCKKLQIIHPSNIDEQKKITSILSNIDNLIDLYDKSIESTTRLKNGLMQQLLIKGIGHKKFKKVKWLFGKEMEIPIGWKYVELNSVVKLQTGFPFKSNEFVQDGIRLLKGSNVLVDRIDWNDLDCFPTEREEEFSNFLLSENDIVIAMDRPFITEGFKIARISDKDLPCFLVQRIGKFYNGKDIDYDFLYHVLNSNSYKINLKIQQKGMDLPHVSKNEILTPKITLPLIDEQQKIASILSNIDSDLFDFASKKNRIEQLKKGLMQKLLTGQIRV